MSQHIYDTGKSHAQQGQGPANTTGMSAIAKEKYDAGYALQE
jgi:hypothetical protein